MECFDVGADDLIAEGFQHRACLLCTRMIKPTGTRYVVFVLVFRSNLVYRVKEFSAQYGTHKPIVDAGAQSWVIVVEQRMEMEVRATDCLVKFVVIGNHNEAVGTRF